MTRTPHEIIKKRRNDVENLYFVMNRTQAEIAKALGWDDKTIWNDIHAIRERWKLRAEEIGDEPLLKYIQRKEMMIRRAMESLLKAVTDRNQQNWIKTIMELDKDLLEKMMDVGIVTRKSSAFNMNVNSVFINDEKLKKFYDNVRRAEELVMDAGSRGDNLP